MFDYMSFLYLSRLRSSKKFYPPGYSYNHQILDIDGYPQLKSSSKERMEALANIVDQLTLLMLSFMK